MGTKHFLLILILVGSTVSEDTHAPGWCMAYESCGVNEGLSNANIRGSIPCYQNIEAPIVRPGSPHFSKLNSVCPDLVKSQTGDVHSCCNLDQLSTLERQLTASVLMFQRCPSCYNNFRNLYCTITCSPDQSTFMNITGTLNMTDEQPHLSVTDELIYISQEFAESIHHSCQDVVFPQTNGKAITLVCNGFSGDDCTPQRFLDYLGSTNNGIAPLNMDFHQIGNGTGPDIEPAAPEPFQPMSSTSYLCNESPGDGVPACSCTDCEASCPAPPPINPPPEPFKIGQANGVGVIMLIIFLTFVLAFTAFLLIRCMCHENKSHVNFRMVELEKHMHAQTEENDIHYEKFGYQMVDESEISCFQRWGQNIQEAIRRGFTWWGTFVARHPFHVLVPTILIVVAMCVGMKFVILTTDPIELWSSAGSRVRIEKDYYDSHFGAFFRTEQVIMTLKPEFVKGGSTYQSFTGVYYNFTDILEKQYLLELLEMQSSIRDMVVEYDDNGVTKNGTLNDICFKPLAPDNNNCTITSVINWWQNDPRELDKTANHTDKISEEEYVVDYRDHFLYCVQAPASIQDTTPLKQNCMGDFGGPVFPFVALGGQGEDGLYNEAPALIVTFVVNNYDKGDPLTNLVKVWEQQFLKTIGEWKPEHFDFTYFSERSPEDELERSSQSDLVVFVISYLVIFVYITVALGTYTSIKRIPVDSKASLGIAGILVILASVLASVGFFGYVGYATSLIVIEVVPFLVLAIGADNVFILTLEYQRTERKEDETREEQIGRVFGNVAPSMLLCSLTECTVFFLGALTDMPAVEQFALAAAVAILFDFLLQITAFLAVLALDAKRQEQNRLDCFCCFKVDDKEKNNTSYLQTFFHKYYAPFLMNDIVRYLVMVVFAGISCWCVVLCTRITIGLDQDLSVPKDSYVLDYFDYMEKYLDVGVPVYFVTKGPYNFSDPESGKYICGAAGCDTYSLTQQISYASDNPTYWKIETPAASWYDDYLDWLPPQGFQGRGSCCRYYNRNPDDFCPASDTTSRCTACLDNATYTSEEFMDFLPWFLIDNPGVECNKGGHSAYGNAVNITNKNFTQSGRDVVEASYFMAYHSVCIKSVDCTENLVKARELADNITNALKSANEENIIGDRDDFTVYPYALYYVFYEQYLTMTEDTLYQLGICIIPTFFFNLLLLGFDFYSGLITLITILMIVVDTAGLCSLWGVDLNAVSLINLVAAIGLSVEFTSHVVRTFSLQTNLTRKERVIESMASMGPAVFAGVALTNLPGIIVLNWATAQLIQIFFFRMCLVITLLGTAHGLIFLPVFLSYFGPPVNKAILFDKQKELREMDKAHGITNLTYKGDTLQYKAKMEKAANEKSTEAKVEAESNEKQKAENPYVTML